MKYKRIAIAVLSMFVCISWSVGVQAAEAGDADAVVGRFYWKNSIQRVERVERVYLRVEHPVEAASWSVEAELHVPEGISMHSPTKQVSEGWERLRVALTTGVGGGTPSFVDAPVRFTEFAWELQAAAPITEPLRVTYSLPDGSLAEATLPTDFQPPHDMAPKDYVPEPQPVTSDYHVGGIYFPGWKPGAHYGWSILDAYPERMPALGYYDESNPEVMDWQIKWAVEHGMNFFMFCWYRGYGTEGEPEITQHLDHALHDGFFNARYEELIDFAIMWENGNLAGVSDMDDLLDNLFPFWMETYFKRPNYLVIDNKPVLYIYDIQRFVNDLGAVEAVKVATDAMREAAREEGFDGLYLLAEHRGDSEYILGMMRDAGIDYSFAYCFHSVPPEATQAEAVEHLHDVHQGRFEMRDLIPDVPTVTVGWNPEPWQTYTQYPETPLWWLEPEGYRAQAENLKALMDAQPAGSLSSRMVMLDNLNEWGEGHYILPHREFGFGYLDGIRAVFNDAPEEHLDLLPEEVGLGPYDGLHKAWVEEVTRKYDPEFTPTADSGAERPIVGAIRWDAWHGDASPVGLVVEETLAASHWHDRLPFYAEAIGENAVKVRANSQAIMDQEIAYASQAGLDYWAFVVYPEEDPLSLGLKLYLDSEYKDDINFCLNLQGGWESGDGPDAWPAKVARYVRYMQESTYQTVLDGRPLIYLFSVEGLVGPGRFETWEDARDAFDLLRREVMDAGLPNPYIVAQGWSGDTLKAQTEALGLDAIGAYAANGGAREASFADLVAHTESVWASFRETGLPVVPLVTSGWDRRPRVETPVPWEDGGDIRMYYEAPTPDELAAHLADAIAWCRQYPQTAEAQALLIYAWNEFDEGGWLCPTLIEGTARLDAIQPLLTTDARSE